MLLSEKSVNKLSTKIKNLSDSQIFITFAQLFETWVIQLN